MGTRHHSSAAAAIASASLALWTWGCDPGGFRLLDTGKDTTFRGVFVAAANQIYAAGTGGTVVVTDGKSVTDTSTNAAMVSRPPDWHGTAVAGGALYVAGDKGLILEKAEKGWSRNVSGITERILTMVRPAPSILYAGGESGRVLRKTTFGTLWEVVDVHAPAGAKVTGGWGQSDRSMVFTTDKGVIIERTNNSWASETVATETSSTPLPLFAVWSATQGADLIAVGLGGAVYRRRGGETTWTQEKTPVTQDLYGIFGTSNSRVYAVGARGAIVLYDGTQWTGVPSGTGNDLFAVGGLADGSVIAAAGAEGTIVILNQ